MSSVVAVGGVALGVAALIVTLAVMSGFRREIQEKILGAQPHLVVSPLGPDMKTEEMAGFFGRESQVKAWSPYILEQALLRRGGSTQGVVVKGVDPARETQVTDLARRTEPQAWQALAVTAQPPSILLGVELAKTLRAQKGDTVFLLVPSSDQLLMSLPAFFPFRVAGTLQTGLYDYDSSLAVMSLTEADRAFGREGVVSGWGARIAHAEDSVEVAASLQKRIGFQATVRSWLGMNRNLFAALRLEKVVMFLILTLITLVAAFTILSNLLLSTAQRLREIGILRAMGASRGSIHLLFLLKGLMLGGVGTGLGTAFGLGLSALLKRYPVIQLPADVYYVERLPILISPADVVLVAGAAMAIVLAATLYPARLAARQDALSAIRQL